MFTWRRQARQLQATKANEPQLVPAVRHESERLRQIIKELQYYRFGRKAETLPEEQMLLGVEDVQQVAACTEAGQDETAPEGRAERARKRRNNRRRALCTLRSGLLIRWFRLLGIRVMNTLMQWLRMENERNCTRTKATEEA